MRSTPDGERGQVTDGMCSPTGVESPSEDLVSKNGENLQIQELGRRDPVALHSLATSIPVGRCGEQGRRDDAGIGDDHRRSLSERTAAVASLSVRLLGVPAFTRSNTSPIVGCAASARR